MAQIAKSLGPYIFSMPPFLPAIQHPRPILAVSEPLLYTQTVPEIDLNRRNGREERNCDARSNLDETEKVRNIVSEKERGRITRPDQNLDIHYSYSAGLARRHTPAQFAPSRIDSITSSTLMHFSSTPEHLYDPSFHPTF
jgi:hypothetical protein